MSEELQSIELSIEQAKETIKNRDDLRKLVNNRMFKNLITEGYFEKEAIRLVLLKATPDMQSEEDQTAIIKAMDAIGGLRQYFTTIMQMGAMADRALKDDEETREEILSEGAE